MGYIVIAIPKHGDACRLKDIIQKNGITSKIVLCKGSREVIVTAKKFDISLVVCTPTVGSMRYETLSQYLPPATQILLLTHENKRNITAENVTNIKIPFKVADLASTVKRLVQGESSDRSKKKVKRSPKDQMVIDKAKQLLIDTQMLSEGEAYRSLQKLSMDTGSSILDTSIKIIALYDDK